MVSFRLPGLLVRAILLWAAYLILTISNVLSTFLYVKIFFKIYLFCLFYFWLHWVFVAVPGVFSSCGERGLLFAAVHWLLTAVASLVAEHRL